MTLLDKHGNPLRERCFYALASDKRHRPFMYLKEITNSTIKVIPLDSSLKETAIIIHNKQDYQESARQLRPVPREEVETTLGYLERITVKIRDALEIDKELGGA